MLFRELFGKSPIEPLQEHMQIVSQAVQLLDDLFRLKFDHDYDAHKVIAKKIMKLEHEADIKKDLIQRNLPSSYMMPMARLDVLALLKSQDRIIDIVEDLAVISSLKKDIFPECIREDFFRYLQKIFAVFDDCYKLVDNLDELMAATFTGPEARYAEAMVTEVEKLEWETDKLEFKFSQKVFEIEDIFTKGQFTLAIKIIQKLARLADCAEKAAKTIRTFLVK